MLSLTMMRAAAADPDPQGEPRTDGGAPPADPASTSSSTTSTSTSDTATEAKGEVIEVRAPWPDADLFMVRDTSRAKTTVQVPSDGRAGTLGDALVGVPGVEVQRTGPGQGAPIIRGLIGSAVLVVVDGMRVNNAIFRPAPNQYTALVDPMAASRIEITRGPGSAMFGSDAVGGVINVISALPRFEGEAWQRQASAAVAVASADTSIASRASVAAGRKGSGISLGATLQRHGDLRAGDGEIQEPSAYDSVAADATGHLERGKHATTAWVQVVNQPSLARTDELRPGFGQDEPSSDVFLYEPSRRTFAHVRHVLRRPVAALDGIELHAAWQRIDDDRKLRDFGSTEQTTEQNHDDSIGVAARALGPALGGEITFGTDYWFDRVKSRRLLQDLSSGLETVDQGRFADGSMMHQLGAFADFRRKIGERVALRAAARTGFTRAEIAVADRMIGQDANSLNWAGEAGVDFTVATNVDLVTNVGRAFRSPNIQDRSGLGPRPGNRFQIPADELTDESVVGADIGIRVRRPRLSAELFGFGAYYGDRIEDIQTGDMTADGRDIVVSQNTGDVRMIGVEGALRFQASEALALDAHTTAVIGEQTTAGVREPADRLPPPAARLGLTWSLPRTLRLYGAVRGALAQNRLSARDKDDIRIDPTGTPGFVTFHAGATMLFGDFEVALRLDNLTDRNYREHGSGTEAAGFDASLLVRWTSSTVGR